MSAKIRQRQIGSTRMSKKSRQINAIIFSKTPAEQEDKKSRV